MSDGLSNPRSSTGERDSCADGVQTSTITRPIVARITDVSRVGHTTITVTDLVLTPGESLLVYGWPPSGKDRDVANAVAVDATTAVIRHPYGNVNRKVWVRRP